MELALYRKEYGVRTVMLSSSFTADPALVPTLGYQNSGAQWRNLPSTRP
jgi:hypothetical protein